MSTTYPSIARGTKVMFDAGNGRIREGVVREGFSRTANQFSPTTRYCVVYRGGEYIVSSDELLEI